jgi:hypothetical protein
MKEHFDRPHFGVSFPASPTEREKCGTDKEEKRLFLPGCARASE